MSVDPPLPVVTIASPTRSVVGSGVRGTVDPTDVVRPSVGDHFRIAVLALTACADLAVFSQVLSRVMPTDGLEIILPAVAGFTACSLGLAHVAGGMLRARDRETRPASLAAVGVWIALGVAAFAARILVHKPVAIGATPEPAATNVAAALLFLALYVGSGLVAGSMAYAANPMRARYHRARRERNAALRTMHRAQAPYEHAYNGLQLHLRNREREKQNYTAAAEQRAAIVTEVKEYARLLLIAHLQDPSATTGITNTALRTRREVAAAAAALAAEPVKDTP